MINEEGSFFPKLPTFAAGCGLARRSCPMIRSAAEEEVARMMRPPSPLSPNLQSIRVRTTIISSTIIEFMTTSSWSRCCLVDREGGRRLSFPPLFFAMFSDKKKCVCQWAPPPSCLSLSLSNGYQDLRLGDARRHMRYLVVAGAPLNHYAGEESTTTTAGNH